MSDPTNDETIYDETTPRVDLEDLEVPMYINHPDWGQRLLCPECGHHLPIDSGGECDSCGCHYRIHVEILAPGIDAAFPTDAADHTDR